VGEANLADLSSPVSDVHAWPAEDNEEVHAVDTNAWVVLDSQVNMFLDAEAEVASGEWGPAKATRLFGLIPLTHQDALIFASQTIEIQFQMSRPLTDFMATLHKNGMEEKKLSKYVSHKTSGDIVTLSVTFPEEGQYGMDIYTRELNSGVEINSNEKHLLTHCCKYLINSSRKNRH